MCKRGVTQVYKLRTRTKNLKTTIFEKLNNTLTMKICLNEIENLPK